MRQKMGFWLQVTHPTKQELDFDTSRRLMQVLVEEGYAVEVSGSTLLRPNEYLKTGITTYPEEVT